ncbi:MAG: hypothetical protein WKG32_03235 [Gemmatimonadaceae bacterium]
MTTSLAPDAWESEGRRVADALDGLGSAVVVSDDAAAGALVALGIGRAHARRRRVAIADLIGEEPTLQALVPEDAEHGIVDALTYGVSLSKIAYPIDPAQNLYILPSGAGPLDHDAMLRSERWHRLAASFEEAGALLLVVAPPRTVAPEALDTLIAATGGAVTVGSAYVADEKRILARVTAPAGADSAANVERSAATITDEIAEIPAGTQAPAGKAAVSDSADDLVPIERADARVRSPLVTWALIAVVALALAVAVYWVWSRGRATGAAAAAQADSTSTPADAGAGAGTLTGDPADLAPTNVADSAGSSAYVVVLANLGDSASAALRMAGDVGALPAATLSPVLLGRESALWYRVTAGAYSSRARADSLLRALRARTELEAQSGEVIRAPISVRLTPPGDVAGDPVAFAQELRASGVATFLLRAADGTTVVYAGAFETPGQAAPFLSKLRTAGINAVLAYRMGNVF